MDEFKERLLRCKPKCTIKSLRKRFPISAWLSQYSLLKLRGDIIAGLTVGMVFVPQSLAFATFAGLPPNYGLYTSYPAGLVYCIFGTAKDVNVGPTVISSFVTKRYNLAGHPATASALAFISGIILFGLGITKVSSIIRYIPANVVAGFVTGASITIAVGQLKGLFGHMNPPRTFAERLKHFFENLGNTNLWDLTMSLICVFVLLVLQYIIRNKLKAPKADATLLRKILYKTVWMICVARSAIVCVCATVVSFLLYENGYTKHLSLPGKLPSGFAPLRFPLQDVFDAKRNRTIDIMDAVGDFGSGLAIVPLILIIESAAIAKTMGLKNRYDVSIAQELNAVGLSNILTGLLGGYPVSGGISRSAVNSASGAETTFSGAIASVIVIMAIAFLNPVFFYIPMAALASMVFSAVIPLIEYKVPIQIWRINKMDIIPYAAGLLGTFYELEIGVLVGSGFAIAVLLFRSARPRHRIVNDIGTPHAYIRINGGLWYPGMEQVLSLLKKMHKANPALKQIEMDFQAVFEMDYSTATGLKQAVAEFTFKRVELVFTNVRGRRVRQLLQNVGLRDQILDLEEETIMLIGNAAMVKNEKVFNEENVVVSVPDGTAFYTNPGVSEAELVIEKADVKPEMIVQGYAHGPSQVAHSGDGGTPQPAVSDHTPSSNLDPPPHYGPYGHESSTSL